MALFTNGRIAACRRLLLLPQKQFCADVREKEDVAMEYGSRGKPGRLNTMFSTISTGKLLTSDLFSDYVSLPLSS